MIEELLQEGKVIQQRLAISHTKADSLQQTNMHHQFVNRMLHGDVKAAISLLDSDEHPGAPMRLNMLLDPDSILDCS